MQSLTSRKTHEKSSNRETVVREQRKREGFLISAAEVMSKRGQQYGSSVILKSVSQNSFLMDDISENIFNEELKKLLVKNRLREDFF